MRNYHQLKELFARGEDLTDEEQAFLEELIPSMYQVLDPDYKKSMANRQANESSTDQNEKNCTREGGLEADRNKGTSVCVKNGKFWNLN